MVFLWVSFVVGRFLWHEVAAPLGMTDVWNGWWREWDGVGAHGRRTGEGEDVEAKKNSSSSWYVWKKDNHALSMYWPPRAPLTDHAIHPMNEAGSTGPLLGMKLNFWTGLSWKLLYPLFLFWQLQSSIKGMMGIVLLLLASEWRLLHLYMMLMEKLHGEEAVKLTPKLRWVLSKR